MHRPVALRLGPSRLRVERAKAQAQAVLAFEEGASVDAAALQAGRESLKAQIEQAIHTARSAAVGPVPATRRSGFLTTVKAYLALTKPQIVELLTATAAELAAELRDSGGAPLSARSS